MNDWTGIAKISCQMIKKSESKQEKEFMYVTNAMGRG
jgi:hypothetical protein